MAKKSITGPWRPAKITEFNKEGLHVVNQLFRETNARVDNLSRVQKPVPQGTPHLAFGTIPAQSSIEATCFVFGAGTSHTAYASPAQGLDIGSPHLSWSARVVGQNKVAVRVTNPTSAGIAVNVIPWNIRVLT